MRRWFRCLVVAGTPAALGGCVGDLSALDPAGPSAASIADLWWVMLWASVALFALVLGLFLSTVLFPNFGRGVSQRRWIILGGLVLPLPVLTALTFYAFAQGEFLLKGAMGGDEEVLEVRAVGRMWQWQFSYPSVSGSPVRIDVLDIPAGRTIEIITESEDVIHSFWVPRLGGKIDAIPGHSNRLRIRADQPGRYGGICSEYCGTGHAGMRFEVRAHTEEDFRRVLTTGEASR
jgi:cytochrome c oxidase subunit II